MAASTHLEIEANDVAYFNQPAGTYQIQNKSYEDLQITEHEDGDNISTKVTALTPDHVKNAMVVGPFQYACITVTNGFFVYMWYEESKGGTVAISGTE